MGLRMITQRRGRATLVGLVCGAMTLSPCMPALAQQPAYPSKTQQTVAPGTQQVPVGQPNLQQPVNLIADQPSDTNWTAGGEIQKLAPGKLSPGKPTLEKDGAALRRSLTFDVALDAQGSLFGEVRDGQGKAQRNTDVVLWQGNQMIQRTRTNGQGQFYFANLQGGIYRIATPDVTLECRAWTSQLAPPSARESLLVVANMYSARGQQPINEVFCFNPFLMGTIVAAAIAIPIAIHDSGDGELSDAVELPDGS